MTAIARRMIASPALTPLDLARDRLDGLAALANAEWCLWYEADGWMVGRFDMAFGCLIDAYGPHVCPRSAAFHAESLELDWSRDGDPVAW